MSWQFESRFLVVFPVLCIYWGVMDQQFMSGTAVLGGLLIGLSSCCSEWFRAWKSEAGAASTGFTRPLPTMPELCWQRWQRPSRNGSTAERAEQKKVRGERLLGKDAMWFYRETFLGFPCCHVVPANECSGVRNTGPHLLRTACHTLGLLDTGMYFAEDNSVGSWDALQAPGF